MKNNNQRGLIIAIIVLSIAVISLGGYIIINRFNDNNQSVNNNDSNKEVEKKDNNLENEQKETELSEAEKNDLMSIIDKLDIVDINNQSLTDVKSIPNQDLLNFAFLQSNKDQHTLYQESYTYQEINEVINKYFNFNIIPEDYLCPMDGEVLFKYDKNNQIFSLVPQHSHGISIMPIENSYYSSSKIEDIYTIKVKKAFGAYDDFGIQGKYYASYDDATSFKNPIFEVEYNDNMEPIKESKELMENHLNELKEYTYTFKKQNNNYILLTYTKGTN